SRTTSPLGSRSRSEGGAGFLLGLAFHLLTFVAVGERRLGQLPVDLGEPLVVRSGHGDDATVLGNLHIGSFGLVADVLPELAGLGAVATLDGVDDDFSLGGAFAGVRVFHIILVVHVG